MGILGHHAHAESRLGFVQNIHANKLKHKSVIQLKARGSQGCMLSIYASGSQLVVAAERLLVVVVVSRRVLGLVQLARDRVHDLLHLLELLLEILRARALAVLLDPLCRLLNRVEDRRLVLLLELATETVVVGDLVLRAL